MNFGGLEITDLKIEPHSKDFAGRWKIKAICIATFNSGLTLYGISIRENKHGVYVKWPLLAKWADKEARKKARNRILATWVINHCMEDYTV